VVAAGWTLSVGGDEAQLHERYRPVALAHPPSGAHLHGLVVRDPRRPREPADRTLVHAPRRALPLILTAAEPGCAQYHLRRTTPPKAMSPTNTRISPTQRLQTTITTIPTTTMVPHERYPAGRSVASCGPHTRAHRHSRSPSGTRMGGIATPELFRT
jgi:hypothetical protein